MLAQDDQSVILSGDDKVLANSLAPDRSTTTPKDYKIFRDLMRWVAGALEISTEELQNMLHKCLDTLRLSVSGHVAISVSEGLLESKRVL